MGTGSAAARRRLPWRATVPASDGARHAAQAHFRRQPHRSHLLPARPVVRAGARQMEAECAARRGAQRRPALVRRRQGPRHVERRRAGLPALHEGLVRPHRRDEGGGLRLGQPSRRQAASDDAGAAHRRSRPRRARQGDHLRLPDDQRPDRRRRRCASGPMPATTTGRPTSRAAPIPTASFRSPSSPTPIPRRRRPRCGAAPGWG